MARFTMSVDMDNEAFDDYQELPRILEAVAARVPRGRPDNRVGTVSIMDANGNRVGSWKIEP